MTQEQLAAYFVLLFLVMVTGYILGFMHGREE
jgi:hypothetical protein